MWGKSTYKGCYPPKENLSCKYKNELPGFSINNNGFRDGTSTLVGGQSRAKQHIIWTWLET